MERTGLLDPHAQQGPVQTAEFPAWRQPAEATEYCALLFLALPLLIFFMAFITWPLAVPALAVILVVLYRSRPKKILAEPWPLALCLGMAVLFLWACAYLPPFGRSWDWLKHFAIVNELARYPWPPVNDETNTYLRYALGFYLVPGLAARLLGERVVEPAVLFETWAGLTLVLLLTLRKLQPRRPVLFVLLFLMFGGLDLLGWYFIGVDRTLLSTKEWWTGSSTLFAYESHATLFLWVPQHALAGLLGLLLVLPDRDGRAPAPGTMGLLGVAVVFWSPFAALGVLPYALAASLRRWREILLDPANIVCVLVLGIPVIAYLSPGTESIPREWVWSRGGFSLGIYAAFVMLEAGLYLLALRLGGGWQHLRYPLIVIAMLLLLPLYRVGIYNDFTMRTCIPTLMLVAAAVAATVSETKGIAWIALAALLCVGICGSVVEIIGRGHDGYVAVHRQTLRSGFLRTDAGLFVQYNAPLPNWVLRH